MISIAADSDLCSTPLSLSIDTAMSVRVVPALHSQPLLYNIISNLSELLPAIVHLNT
jgi:hypothetical protein